MSQPMRPSNVLTENNRIIHYKSDIQSSLSALVLHSINPSPNCFTHGYCSNLNDFVLHEMVLFTFG